MRLIILILFILLNGCNKEELPKFKTLGKAQVEAPKNSNLQDHTIYFNLPSSSVTLSGTCDARTKYFEVKIGNDSNWVKAKELAATVSNNCAKSKNYEITFSPVDDLFEWQQNIENQRKSIFVRGHLGTISSQEIEFTLDSQYAYLIEAPVITSSNSFNITSTSDSISITGTCLSRLKSMEYSTNGGSSWNEFSSASNGSSFSCSVDQSFVLNFNPAVEFINFDRNENSQSHIIKIRGKDEKLISAPAIATVTSNDFLPPIAPKLTVFSNIDNPIMYITEKPENTDVVGYECSVDQTTWFSCNNSDIVTNNGTPYNYLESGTLYLKSKDDIGLYSEIVSVPFKKGLRETGIMATGHHIYEYTNNNFQISHNYLSSGNTTLIINPLRKVNLISFQENGLINSDFKPYYHKNFSTSSNLSYSRLFNDPNTNKIIAVGNLSLYSDEQSNFISNFAYISEAGEFSTYTNETISYSVHSNSFMDLNGDIYFYQSYGDKLYKLDNLTKSIDTILNPLSRIGNLYVSDESIYLYYGNLLKKYNKETLVEDIDFTTNVGSVFNGSGYLHHIFLNDNKLSLFGTFNSFNEIVANNFVTLNDNGAIHFANDGEGFSYSTLLNTVKHNPINQEFILNYTSSSSIYKYNNNSLILEQNGNFFVNTLNSNGDFNAVNMSDSFNSFSYFESNSSNFFTISNTTPMCIKKLSSNYILDSIFSSNSCQNEISSFSSVSQFDNGNFLFYNSSINLGSTEFSTTTSYSPLLKNGNVNFDTSDLIPYYSKLKKLPNEKYLIYGNFQSIQGRPFRYLARLNSDLSLDLTFVPSLLSGPIKELFITSDGNIYIYTYSSTASTGSIFKLNPNGEIDQSEDGFNDHKGTTPFPSSVKQFLVSPSEQWLYFSPYSSGTYRDKNISRYYIYRVSTSTGEIDEDFSVYSSSANLFTHNDKVYISSYNSGNRSNVHIINDNGILEDQNFTISTNTDYRNLGNFKNNKIYSTKSNDIYIIDMINKTTSTVPINCPGSSVVYDDVREIYHVTFDPNVSYCQNRYINGIASFDKNGIIIDNEYTGFFSSE